MKNLIKLFILCTLFFVGCTTTKTYSANQKSDTFSAEFNQTHYIWEGFIFPTNKTTGK